MACWRDANGSPMAIPCSILMRFVFYTWGVRRELPMAELKNYTAHKDRLLKRAAVARVVADEKIKVQ